MFQFYMPTKVIIGRECVVKEGHLLKGIGNKALIVTGRYSAKKNGALKDVIKALEEQNIDLILLDLIMPETDGFELYKLIREKYKIPVVIVTADKRLETIQKISELGIDDYLTKPVHSFVLKEIVHGITDSRE